MATQDEIKAFQKRLEDAFSYNEVVGGRFLLPVINMEKEVGSQFVEKYHGHRRLTDSFLDFFAETLTSQASYNARHGWPKEPYYLTCLMMYVTMFRAARSAEILSTEGYPMQGYALLRSVKDQIWTLCAAASRLATFAELFGWDGINVQTWNDEAQGKIVANRIKIEAAIREQITGAKSGLSAETREQLLKWERMFNAEAHRGLYSLFRASEKLVDPQGPGFSLVPAPDELLDAMFINRSTETNWMILRLLPFVRREEADYKGWTEKWKLLDESFAFMVEGLTNMGKKIGPAFVELLGTKFKFDPKTFYSEPPDKPKEAPKTSL